MYKVKQLKDSKTDRFIFCLAKFTRLLCRLNIILTDYVRYRSTWVI